jgi:hypothetical protein
VHADPLLRVEERLAVAAAGQEDEAGQAVVQMGVL